MNRHVAEDGLGKVCRSDVNQPEWGWAVAMIRIRADVHSRRGASRRGTDSRYARTWLWLA